MAFVFTLIDYSFGNFLAQHSRNQISKPPHKEDKRKHEEKVKEKGRKEKKGKELNSKLIFIPSTLQQGAERSVWMSHLSLA